MLHEVRDIRQIAGEHRRKWYQEENLDLMVWFEEDGTIYGFQLCYPKGKFTLEPHTLTWFKGKGYFHHRVDEGRHFSTPILVADGVFTKHPVAELFWERRALVPEEIARFVRDKILEYPGR